MRLVTIEGADHNFKNMDESFQSLPERNLFYLWMAKTFSIVPFIFLTKEEIQMKWLILLALIPLSRILFNIGLCFGHRKKNMEDEYGINIAKRMLVRLGLHDKVNVMLEGNDDCYDPSKNTISLGEKNNRKTVASVAIAIHEVGHALQMNEGWQLYLLRCKIILMKVPLIYITAVLVIFGFAYKVCNILAIISLICLIVCTVVELIVEINASIRGCKLFEKYFRTNRSEMSMISFLLSMAALTYFADIINCIYMVGRLIIKMLSNGGREKNEDKRNGVI